MILSISHEFGKSHLSLPDIAQMLNAFIESLTYNNAAFQTLGVSTKDISWPGAALIGAYIKA